MAAREFQCSSYSGDLYRRNMGDPRKSWILVQTVTQNTVATAAKKKTYGRILNNAEKKLKLLKANKNPHFRDFLESKKKLNKEDLFILPKNHSRLIIKNVKIQLKLLKTTKR